MQLPAFLCGKVMILWQISGMECPGLQQGQPIVRIFLMMFQAGSHTAARTGRYNPGKTTRKPGSRL